MDGNSLIFAHGWKRNGDGAVGRIYTAYQSSQAVFLPLFAFVGFFFGDVRLLDGDNRGRKDGFSVVGELATYKDAVPSLEVRQRNWRGVFQVLLPGRNTKELRGILDLNSQVGAR